MKGVSYPVALGIMGNKGILLGPHAEKGGYKDSEGIIDMGRLQELALVPFSRETLAEKADSHILVAVPPMSLLKMSADEDLKEMFYIRRNPWYAKQMFSKDISPGWHLLPRVADPIYFNKNWVEQVNCLPAGHKVATAATVVCAMLARYRATGEMLYRNILLRCADVPGGRGSGEHAVVIFTGRLIFVGRRNDMDSGPDIALATEIAS